MKGIVAKLAVIVVGSSLLFACACPTPQVAEKAEAKPVPEKPVLTEPDCCKKLENELKALKLQVESLKSQLDNIKVQAGEAQEAAKKAIEAANRAEAAAQKAEAAAQKAERIFEKGLKK